MTAYTVSKAGLALIQDAEGFRAEPGQLPDGSWVVGFSHVRAEAGETISEADAVHLLSMDLAAVERLVNEKVITALTQSQFDALVSFAFSVGADAFEQSQMLRRVNAGEFVAAACAMDAWRKSDASGELEVVDALVRRRAAEKALFLKDMPCEAAPSAFVRAKLDHAASILGAPIKFATPPAVGSIPYVQPKAPIAQIAEILKSEPDTQELLLTQVVSDDAGGDDEIVTARAKPVARKLEMNVDLPIDRRIRNKKDQPFTLPAFRWTWSQQQFETFGLAALMLFGLVLVGMGASLLLEGKADGVALLGASALCAPGIAAVLLATYGFVRTPRVKVRAD